MTNEVLRKFQTAILDSIDFCQDDDTPQVTDEELKRLFDDKIKLALEEVKLNFFNILHSS